MAVGWETVRLIFGAQGELGWRTGRAGSRSGNRRALGGELQEWGDLGFEPFLWFSQFRRKREAATGEGECGARGADAVSLSWGKMLVVTWGDFGQGGECRLWPLAGLWSCLVSEGEEGVKI